MTNQEITELFRRVNNKGTEGGFITYFCKAFIVADGDNQNILRTSALMIIEKYQLDIRFK